MIGGMGVDISTADLALEAARLGGIGHISDANAADGGAIRRYDTGFVKEKLQRNTNYNIDNSTSRRIKFDSRHIAEIHRLPRE